MIEVASTGGGLTRQKAVNMDGYMLFGLSTVWKGKIARASCGALEVSRNEGLKNE